MHQAMLNAKKVGSSPDVKVVIQFGRAKYELVKLIRQNTDLRSDDSWSGVRRYLFAKGSSFLVGNLESTNMADPKTLYDFIKWGMRFYPANKYMLIMGGHGYQFVGMMTDYSKKAPYIMGIPELAGAINMAANEIGKKIDILVLDTCYFNSIEVIYELGRDENHSVQSAIAPIKNGALEGLPYDKIIELVQRNSNVKDVTAVIRDIIDNLSYDLVAFEINHQKLKQIKQLFNDAASEYLSRNIDDGDTLIKKVLDEPCDTIRTVELNLLSLVIHSKRVSPIKSPLVIVANSPTDNFKLLLRYYRLGFAQGNCWTRLLSNKPKDVNMAAEQKRNLLPLKMRPSEVYAYISIMNPGLDEIRKIKILKDLYQYKKW